MRIGKSQWYIFQRYCVPLLAEHTVSAVMQLFHQSYLCNCHNIKFHMLFVFIEATDNLTRRQKIFSAEQEAGIIDTVVAKKNAVRLCEIQATIITDQGAFRNIKKKIGYY